MNIGAVLTYYNHGSSRAGGQTVGADGAGWKSVVFTGDPDNCHEEAKGYLEKVRKHSRIDHISLVVNNEEYCGYPIKIIEKD